MSGVLRGQGAVVTGAGGGIGAAVARVLAGAGARLALVARTPGAIQHVADVLRSGGAEISAIHCDLTDEAAVRVMTAEVETRLGAVDVLVHAAGASASARLEHVSLDDWNRMMAANATSAFLSARAFLPGMMERGHGRFVAVASVAGLEGAKYIAHYAASKHAVIGLVRCIAAEGEGRGVTANAVCPGYVDTLMTRRTLDEVGARTGRTREQALAAVLATTGQMRLATVDEVATAVLSLCGPDAPNGTEVIVKGGPAG